jgi:hypothetical protein
MFSKEIIILNNKFSTLIVRASLQMEFISSNLTLHLLSSEQVLKLAESVLMDSGPRTSTNLLAASIPLCYQPLTLS